MLVFLEQRLAEEYVRCALVPDVPERLAQEVAEQFVFLFCDGEDDAIDWPNDLTDEELEARVEGPLHFGGPWAIREKDLYGINDVWRFATAIGATGHVTPVLLLSVCCGLWRLQRRGAAINPLQKQVLIVLRSAGALAVRDLVKALNLRVEAWSSPDVETAVSELMCVRLNDGSVEPLVQRAADGRWSTDARGLWELPGGSIG